MSVEGVVPWNGPIGVTASGVVDLARLNPLLESAGRRIAGTVDVNAKVAGTLAAPTVKGAVQLHKGAVHDYRHGIDLTAIEGTLEGTENELRITQLSAHAATGTVSASGTLGILQGGWPVDMKFTAREAQPFSSSIVSGTVNADLDAAGHLAACLEPRRHDRHHAGPRWRSPAAFRRTSRCWMCAGRASRWWRRPAADRCSI